MSALFASDRPAVPVCGIHLDLKGVPPTPQRLLSLLKVIAAARYNALLVEWEDMFPWTVDVRFRCETAYTPEQVADFACAASDLGLEIVPLVQCLGHMETPLSVLGYEPLREQIALETADARRRASGMACGCLRDLKRHLGVGAAGAAAKARAAFAGRIDPIWLERYLGDRLDPLWEELGGLEPRVRQLEPEAYRGMFEP